MKRRLRKLEQKLTLQQAEFERAERRGDERRSVGIVTRPCTECEDGWIVKKRNRIICRRCGYTYYL
jgi:ribosomal protein S27AE